MVAIPTSIDEKASLMLSVHKESVKRNASLSYMFANRDGEWKMLVLDEVLRDNPWMVRALSGLSDETSIVRECLRIADATVASEAVAKVIYAVAIDDGDFIPVIVYTDVIRGVSVCGMIDDSDDTVVLRKIADDVRDMCPYDVGDDEIVIENGTPRCPRCGSSTERVDGVFKCIGCGDEYEEAKSE